MNLDITQLVAAFKSVVVKRLEEEENSILDNQRLILAEDALSDSLWKLARAERHLTMLEKKLEVRFEKTPPETEEKTKDGK